MSNNREVSSQSSAPESFPPILDAWYLTGPTASGKTDVGVELAKLLRAEVISVDSMALYRHMDIGTAKPDEKQRQQVAHYLIDVLEPWQSYSIAAYLQQAHQLHKEIRNRGREVLFVGGTPLYLKALLRGLFVGPEADWQLRKRLEKLAAENPPGYLHAQLAQVDPETARRLHPNDTRRIIRALEVYEKTGRPISSLQQQFHKAHKADECRVFVLNWPREKLRRRIEERVDRMFAAGLVEETRRLLEMERPLSHTAAQALGYREVLDYLQNKQSLEETIRLVKIHTWQMARRQLTWFRSLSECRWIDVDDPFDPGEVAQRIYRSVEG